MLNTVLGIITVYLRAEGLGYTVYLKVEGLGFSVRYTPYFMCVDECGNEHNLRRCQVSVSACVCLGQSPQS